MPMNQAVKADWIKALRSGEYEQGRQALAQRDVVAGKEIIRYCCLGVLCDLAVKAGLPLNTSSTDLGAIEYNGHGAYLPDPVAEWAGIGHNPEVTYQDGTVTLAYLNDGSVDPVAGELPDHDFGQIADLIEAQL